GVVRDALAAHVSAPLWTRSVVTVLTVPYWPSSPCQVPLRRERTVPMAGTGAAHGAPTGEAPSNRTDAAPRCGPGGGGPARRGAGVRPGGGGSGARGGPAPRRRAPRGYQGKGPPPAPARTRPPSTAAGRTAWP